MRNHNHPAQPRSTFNSSLTLDPNIIERLKTNPASKPLGSVNPHKDTLQKEGSIKKIYLYAIFFFAWVGCMYVLVSKTSFINTDKMSNGGSSSENVNLRP